MAENPIETLNLVSTCNMSIGSTSVVLSIEKLMMSVCD